MSDLVIFATSVFSDLLRAGRHRDRMESVKGLVRTSAVVLAELWRGATKPAERQFLLALERNSPVLIPTARNWLESGQLLSRMNADKGFTREKLRALHCDVLIALTARFCGARLITANAVDFELIRAYRTFALEIWS